MTLYRAVISEVQVYEMFVEVPDGEDEQLVSERAFTEGRIPVTRIDDYWEFVQVDDVRASHDEVAS